MASELDAFLASEAGDGGASASSALAPTPEPAQPAAAAPEPKPEQKADRATAAPEEPAEAEPPEPLDGEPVIPRRAYEDERRKRQDWKEKAARAEGELAALKRQLEDATRVAQQPAQQHEQPAYRPPPDPATDPAGYMQYASQVQLERQINHQLNVSEMLMRKEVGVEKVREYQAEFRKMAEADPTLFGKLYAQQEPYEWMRSEVERSRTLRDMGDDPTGYRSRIEQEVRAKLEAEYAARQPAPLISPAAGQQPSLANVRSVAPRTADTWTGEPSLDDVLAPIQNRKRANGQLRTSF